MSRPVRRRKRKKMADNWFDQMDKAMQARKVAIAGRDRWQEKVDTAEAAIAQLTALRDAPAPTPDLTDALRAAADEFPSRPHTQSVDLTAPAGVYVQQ
jgi:hypothetical protein